MKISIEISDNDARLLELYRRNLSVRGCFPVSLQYLLNDAIQQYMNYHRIELNYVLENTRDSIRRLP